MGNTIQKLAFPVPDPATPLDHSINYKFLKLEEGYKIPVLYLPHSESDRVLIFSHQNGADLGGIEDYLKYLREQLKISIVGYEYLGYGHSSLHSSCHSKMDNDSWSMLNSCSTTLSGGESTYREFPSEEGCYKSLWRTYNWVQKDLYRIQAKYNALEINDARSASLMRIGLEGS